MSIFSDDRRKFFEPKTFLSGIAYEPIRTAYVPLRACLECRLGSPHRKA